MDHTARTGLTEPARAALRQRLGELFTGRKVIAGIAPLAGFVEWVQLLQEVDARRPLLVASGTGAGPVPSPDEADVVMLDAPAPESMTDVLRAQDRLARNLPQHVRTAIERYDGRGEAVWMVGPFIATEPILGRPVLGGRPTSWTALEDKLLAEEIWAEVGYPRAPSRVVRCEERALAGATAELDDGAGVVWAGDARDGFNGGGDFVRWVADRVDADRALDFFAPRCDRIRVMPFLDGVPCSIHGIVLPDGVAAFRPLELAILRGAGRTFLFGGRGSTWDPPAADREQMRQLVRDVGEHLRERVGYRGAFGIDGVLTATGFRPTELNPRASGGIIGLSRPVDPGLFTLLQFNLVAGRDPGVTADQLESWALPLMDARRFSQPIALSHRLVATDRVELAVCWQDRALHRSPVETGWTVSVGPNPSGTFARLVTPPDAALPTRTAALNVALMRFLDAELGTAFGDVSMAPDLRTEAAASEA